MLRRFANRVGGIRLIFALGLHVGVVGIGQFYGILVAFIRRQVSLFVQSCGVGHYNVLAGFALVLDEVLDDDLHGVCCVVISHIVSIRSQGSGADLDGYVLVVGQTSGHAIVQYEEVLGVALHLGNLGCDHEGNLVADGCCIGCNAGGNVRTDLLVNGGVIRLGIDCYVLYHLEDVQRQRIMWCGNIGNILQQVVTSSRNLDLTVGAGGGCSGACSSGQEVACQLCKSHCSIGIILEGCQLLRHCLCVCAGCKGRILFQLRQKCSPVNAGAPFDIGQGVAVQVALEDLIGFVGTVNVACRLGDGDGIVSR